MTNYHDEILKFEEIAKEHTQYMRNSINLIASENVTSVEVTEALATDFARGAYCETAIWQITHTQIITPIISCFLISNFCICLSLKILNPSPAVTTKLAIDKNNKSVLIFMHPNIIHTKILNAKYETSDITHQFTKFTFSSDFLNNTKTASIAITVKQ